MLTSLITCSIAGYVSSIRPMGLAGSIVATSVKLPTTGIPLVKLWFVRQQQEKKIKQTGMMK